MQTAPPDDLLTAAELAERFRVRPGTVLGWYRSGRIPARKLSHKVLRFHLADVMAALEALEPRRAARGREADLPAARDAFESPSPGHLLPGVVHVSEPLAAVVDRLAAEYSPEGPHPARPEAAGREGGR